MSFTKRKERVSVEYWSGEMSDIEMYFLLEKLKQRVANAGLTPRRSSFYFACVLATIGLKIKLKGDEAVALGRVLTIRNESTASVRVVQIIETN